MQMALQTNRTMAAEMDLPAYALLNHFLNLIVPRGPCNMHSLRCPHADRFQDLRHRQGGQEGIRQEDQWTCPNRVVQSSRGERQLKMGEQPKIQVAKRPVGSLGQKNPYQEQEGECVYVPVSELANDCRERQDGDNRGGDQPEVPERAATVIHTAPVSAESKSSDHVVPLCPGAELDNMSGGDKTVPVFCPAQGSA